MKIIDILDRIAKGILENNFTFKFRGIVYKYDRAANNIYNEEQGHIIDMDYNITQYLEEEVEVIEENIEIEELNLENEKLQELADFMIAVENRVKINELVRAVNKLIKESEEK